MKKNWMYLVIGVATLLVLLWVMSQVAGLFFWGAIGLFIAAVAYLFVKKWTKKRGSSDPAKGYIEPGTENDIDRIIKDMERMTGKT